LAVYQDLEANAAFGSRGARRSRPLSLQLLQFLYREAGASKRLTVFLSLSSGLLRSGLLVLFSVAAASTEDALRLELGLAFAAALALYLGLAYYARRQLEQVVQTMVLRLRLSVCEKLLFAELRFVEGYGTGEIHVHLGSDVDRLGGFLRARLGGLQPVIVMATALAYLGWLSVPGLIAVVATIAVGTGLYLRLSRRAAPKLEAARQRESDFYQGMTDLLRGFKELKLSRARHIEFFAHLDKIAVEYRDLMVQSEAMFTISNLTSQAFLMVAVGLLVFVVPHALATNTTTTFQFLATILFAIGPVEELVSFVPTFSRAKIGFKRLAGLDAAIAKSAATQEDRALSAKPLSFEKIALANVRFRFEDGEDRAFDLGPIDLEFRRGETVFICGGNGAGKTTLLKLLTGLYAPMAGEILVDGRPIEPAERQRYREIFAAVFNDFHLFRRLYGIAEPGAEAVTRLFGELQIEKKTALRNRDFSTIDLSTGQRKRLAYAVARLGDRRVYVFDEFAADQDPNFRAYFYTAILPTLKAQGKTVIAVTHDDRWFHAGDRLVKLDYGRAVELTEKPN
jgi:putative ATP-binding cassette transporter